MNKCRLCFSALAVILMVVSAYTMEAQVGPDAYKPVVVSRKIKGRVVKRTRKPRYRYEAYENYKFDAAFKVSDRTDLEIVSDVRPFLHTRFGGTANEDLNAKIHNFLGFLQFNQTLKGYIVVYVGREDTQSVLLQKAFASSLKDHLIKYGIDAARVITVDGGVNDDRLTIEFCTEKQ